MADAAETTCAGKPAQKGHPLRVERMMGLHTAAMMLGGIEGRCESTSTSLGG